MSVTPERWKHIEAVFEKALTLPPDERPDFLERTCNTDDELRKEVESLLSSHERAGSMLDHQSLFVSKELSVEPQVSLTVGESIGRYKIISLLGKGGMGEVYRAHDPELDRDVAIKVVPEVFSADSERLQRFVREAKAASALNHPNILTIHEIGRAGQVRFIVTEYVAGDTLRNKIHRDKVDLDTLLGYFVQIADGLAKAHAAGIIHRDLKPDNIMISSDDYAKILDFGLAKLVEPNSFGANNRKSKEVSTTLHQFSTPGLIVGTVGYMSPQQAQGKAVDHRSDIFSFGCVLYEAATGRPPFAGDSVIDTMHKIIYEPAVPIEEINPVVPIELQDIVNKCLAKNPAERYETIKDAGLDLKELLRKIKSEPQQGVGVSIRRDGEAMTRGSKRLTHPSRPDATATVVGHVTQLPASSAEYIVGEIKQHRKAAIAVLATSIVVAVAIAYLYFASANKSTINSLAVLPFTNVGGDPEAAYLSEGITESLITSLSHVPDLRMIAFNSVLRYRGKETDAQGAGRELGVQAVLTGRVVQRGDNLLISAELLNVKDGSLLLGEQYNRKLTDLIGLQQEIARDVSRKLRTRLSGENEQRVAKNYTENAEAYRLYLKGRYHALRLTPPEVQIGISYFQQAIELDPSYALAYVGLADAYRLLPISTDLPSTEFLPKAKASVQKALEIDEALADAHAAFGAIVFWYEWNWKEAENQSKRALELNPNLANAHLIYAHLLSETGRHQEALAEIKRATELDPLSPYANALEAQFLLHAGKPDEALARLQKTFELDANFWLAHLFASSTYIEKGMYAEAIAEARKSKAALPQTSHATAFEAYALAKSGKGDEARKLLGMLLRSSNERYVPPYTIAMIYNSLDERNETLTWLEKGYQQRDPRMVFLKVEPKWNNLRDDSQFQDLMRRVGFD